MAADIGWWTEFRLLFLSSGIWVCQHDTLAVHRQPHCTMSLQNVNEPFAQRRRGTDYPKPQQYLFENHKSRHFCSLHVGCHVAFWVRVVHRVQSELGYGQFCDGLCATNRMPDEPNTLQCSLQNHFRSVQPFNP